MTARKPDTRRNRIRPAADRQRDNARRVTIRTDHPGLREHLPRLARATDEQADRVVESIAAIFARDGGGPSTY